MKYKHVSHLFSKIKTSQRQSVSFNTSLERGMIVDVKRDDLLHTIISGNKWRKLKYLLLSIEEKGYTSVASMGGAYSNFLHALSYVCYLLDWQCELFVRAYPEQAPTATLRDCQKWGAKVNYVSRKVFRDIRENQPHLPSHTFWLKEGGMHKYAVLGMQEILMELTNQYHYICLASATGTSLSGLAIGAKKYQPNAKVIGISVLNNASQQRLNVMNIVPEGEGEWHVVEGYEFGGFAKKNQQLNNFVKDFSSREGIGLEPVYSGKLFYAVGDLINQNYFKKDSRVLLIHCGGMQGIR